MKKIFVILTATLFFTFTFTSCDDYGHWNEDCGCYDDGSGGYGQDDGYGDQVDSYAPYGAYSSGPLAGYPSDQMDIGYYDNGLYFSSAHSSYGEHTDLKIECDYWGWEFVGINTTWEEKYDMDGYYVEGYYELSGYYTFGRMANPDGSQDTIWIAQKDPITKIWKQIDVNRDSVMALRTGNVSM